MADDRYDESSDAPSESMSDQSSDKDNTDSTALLPKSFFQGKELEPGKQCKVEVVHVYEDEVEVKYVRHEDSEEKSESEPEMAMVSEPEDKNYE